jgi:uncharacterized protein
MLYRTSPHLKIVARGLEYAVYNTLQPNSLMFLNDEALAGLMEFEQPSSVVAVAAGYPDFAEAREVIESFIESGLLIPDKFDEREALARELVEHKQALCQGKLLRGVVLEMTKNCNLRCSYCFAWHLGETTERPLHENMPEEIMYSAINFLFENAVKQRLAEVDISFMGGEPLLVWPRMQAAMVYAQELSHNLGVEAQFKLTTNGTLLTEEITQELAERNVQVSVSLDGPREINDRTRYYPDKSSTFDDIVRGINNLCNAHITPIVLTTISRENYHQLDREFVDFLLDLGVRDWGINLEDIKAMLAVDYNEVADYLLDLSYSAQRAGLNTAGMWFKPIFSLTRMKKAYCLAATGECISVETNGDIYACSKTKNPIGKVSDFPNLFASPDYLDVGSRIIGSNQTCVGCSVEGLCAGGCLAVEEVSDDNCSACNLTGCGRTSCDFIRLLTERMLADEECPLVD